MTVPEFTCVVGVDAHCLKYLKHTVPTWRKNQPDLFSRPWLVFYDSEQIPDLDDVRTLLSGPTVRYVPWLGGKGYAGQREKMLSGHAYISRLVETKYSLKIDCDAMAAEPVEFPKAEWFEGDPVLVGPAWGYSRAKGDKRTLDEWVEIMEAFGDRWYDSPRQNWSEKIGSRDHRKGPKLKEPRFVSWLGFQRTSWVRDMCHRFEDDFGPGRLPVPSHDTSLWMASVRAERLIRFGRQYKRGWINRVTQRSCKMEAAKILAG